MKNKIKTLVVWLAIGLILTILVSSISDNAIKKMAYSDLITNIEAGQVEEITIGPKGETAEVKLKDDNIKKEVNITSVDNLMTVLGEPMAVGQIKVNQESESWLTMFLMIVGIGGFVIILLSFLFVFMSGNQAGKKSMSFGKSKARVLNQTEKNKITL